MQLLFWVFKWPDERKRNEERSCDLEITHANQRCNANKRGKKLRSFVLCVGSGFSCIKLAVFCCVAYSAMESRRVSLNVNFHFHSSFASCFVFSAESTFARLKWGDSLTELMLCQRCCRQIPLLLIRQVCFRLSFSHSVTFHTENMCIFVSCVLFVCSVD